ncbi:ABC transporter substrate-binding protein [Xanthobacter sp. KR7-65]|uniref:ABC transporter substrate-binding protein n=1 Tax=Xanthobacter sp. KR7-65 TaxID=3156612 RepID=UPI0032B333C6
MSMKHLGAVLAAALVLSPVAGHAQTKITAGVAAFNEALAPIYAATSKGYFKDAGLTVEMVDFKGGGAAVKALVGGSIDACLCAADHVIRLTNAGMPAKELIGLDEHHSYALMALAGAPYTGLASLKGKRIAITSPGSLTDNTLRYMIKKAGLSPDTDFEIIATGGGAPMRAAIDTKQVDAGLLITTDVIDMLSTEGKYKVVEDYRAMAYPSFGVLVLDSWIKSHPKEAKGLAIAVRKAIDDLHADPKFAQETIAKMYPNFSPKLVAAVAESMVSRMPKGGIVSQPSFDNLNAIAGLENPSAKPVPLSQGFDPSLLKP